MAQGERRPNLGQRVLGSAKGLACSTFSGVVGIENELRDPISALSVKATSTPADTGRALKEGSTSRRRPSSSSSSSSSAAGFRSRSLTQQPNHQDEMDEWIDRKPEQLESIGENEQDFATQLPSQDPSFQAYQDIFEFGANTQKTAHSTLERSWQKSKSAAATERLIQLERHISGAFALRTRSRTFVEPYGGLDLQDQPHPGLLEVMSPFSNEQQHKYLQMQLQNAPSLLQSALHPPQSGISPSTRWFTCPKPSCHDLLIRQNTHLPLSILQRCCIHTGCGYVSESLDGWLSHCTSAHHLTQSESEPVEETCLRCKYNEFDTH